MSTTEKEHGPNRQNGEQEMTVGCHIVEIPELGYGDPDAKISLANKLESGELYEPAVSRGVEIIRSGECMAAVTDPDDGCIDGRQALYLLYPSLGTEGGFTEIDVTNPFEHKRAKVAGGGYITALVMKLALDPHITHVNIDLEGVAEHLTHLGVYCGAHTGSHGHGGSVDCGANDKFDGILDVQKQKEKQISETVKALWDFTAIGAPYSEEVEGASQTGVARTLSHEGYFDGSTGEDRFKVIMDCIARTQQKVGGSKPVAVSKHLNGDHNEAFIVLNTVKGTTFSQAAFRQMLKTEFPDVPEEQLPQAFVLDMWRVEDLARAMAKGRPDEDEAVLVALHAGLGFQFATAATLTDGSLRNFMITDDLSS